MKDTLIEQLPEFDNERRSTMERVYYLSGLYLAKRLSRKEHDELDELVVNDEQCEKIFATLTYKEGLGVFLKALAGLKQDKTKKYL
ncbi:MAG: hypothetical protein J7502_20100 [Flavisolibacter sp.]|nr:hypothetical protein [Flavisolibacter sp.]